jgi:gas vesicle protein
MRTLLSLLIGFGIGAAIGAALVVVFAPDAGEQISARLKSGWEETLAEARTASAVRRAELEAELAAMQQKRIAR